MPYSDFVREKKIDFLFTLQKSLSQLVQEAAGGN